jgi:hypothetical protein
MRQLELFRRWLDSQDKRNAREWAMWDGAMDHALLINDEQCRRIEAAKVRLACPNGLATKHESKLTP